MAAPTTTKKKPKIAHVEPFYRDGWLTAYQGDARAVMAGFPNDCVHAVVTSPPYFGLRDYGLPDQIWGEDPYSPHRHDFNAIDECACGAWRGQLGLEPTVDLYVAHLVEVFRAVKRVLRPDGSVWLNLGDSFDGKKNLNLMPERAVLALQADGWLVRKDIVWAKPNPMPESVDDRPAKSFEYVYLLTKSAQYYYDVDAMRQITATGAHNLRDVWTISADPYPASHFSVFPNELAIPPVRSGTSPKGACEACGAPLVRVTERTPMVLRRSARTHSRGQTRASGTMLAAPSARTTGWERTCKHPNAGVVPAIVMDPFAGTGTVGVVARQYLRRAIMIDVDVTYLSDRLVTRAEYDTDRQVSDKAWWSL